MHGGVFFEEEFLLHAPGIALHGERPSGEMRHQIRRNADVVIDDLSLGEAGGGIEDLVKVRETELAALDFDDGGSGHGGRWSLVVRRWSFVAGRSLFVVRCCHRLLATTVKGRCTPNDQRLTTSDG